MLSFININVEFDFLTMKGIDVDIAQSLVKTVSSNVHL
jgi:hypothetical protein